MRKNRIALHQLRQDHDGDNQAVQGDGFTQGHEDQALTEGLFVLARSEADLRHALADAANQPDIAVLLVTEKIAETYTATLDSARAAGGPLLITVPSTGGGAAGKDRLTRYIREAIGVKI